MSRNNNSHKCLWSHFLSSGWLKVSMNFEAIYERDKKSQSRSKILRYYFTDTVQPLFYGFYKWIVVD